MIKPLRPLQSLKSFPNRVVSNIAGDFYSKNNLSEKRRIAERTQMEQEEDRQDKLSGMKEIKALEEGRRVQEERDERDRRRIRLMKIMKRHIK